MNFTNSREYKKHVAMMKNKAFSAMKKHDKKKKVKDKIEIPTRNRKIPTKYYDYIKSIFWTKRKNLFYKKHKKECAVCHSNKYIQLHHKKYDWREFGNEPDSDLCPLCITCHNDFHKMYGVKRESDMELLEFALARISEKELEETMEILKGFLKA